MNMLLPIEPIRQRPSNEEAEQALLGAILLNNAAIDRTDGLSPDHFYIPVHGRIFAACRDIIGSGRVADNVTLRAAFQGDATLSEVGGAGYLGRLLTQAVPAPLVGGYAEAIRDCWLRRELIARAEDAMERAYTEPNGREQIEAMEADLFGLAERDPSAGCQSLAEALADMMAYAERQSTGEVIPVDTGLRDVDAILDGLMPGDLTVIGARPGIGKTSLASGIALHNARQGRPVGFFQMEMHGRQMAARALSGAMGVPVKPILRGRLRYDEWEAATKAQAALAKLPVFLDARAGVPLDQFIPRARRMKRQHGIALLIVDYLGLIRVPGVSSYERVTQVSQVMKELARDLDIHVIALHQLNRAVEGRDTKRPTLSDLRDSGSVEQDADNVVFIHREEVALRRAEPDPSDMAKHGEWSQRLYAAQGRAELVVDKQRNGSTGTALLRFDARTTTFGDG